jgi:hypothetical protein
MTTTTRVEPAEPNAPDPADAPADDPAARDPSWFTRVTARPRVVVATSAVIAGTWALIGSRVVFPFLSNDHDEAVYLLQANAIEHGHLFPKAGAQPEAFWPWLTALHGHHFIPKYAPVYPTMLAIGRWTFGTERAALAMIAAGVIIMTYLLATEILDDRRHAALASVFMLVTPLFIVQSATFLPYSAGLLLLTSFAYCLLRGLRVNRGVWLALAGLLLGLAFFARPYDAILFMLPLAGYVIVRYRKHIRQLLGKIGWVLLGLIPPAIAMAAFDAAATGSSLKSPFSLLDSRDTIGFGNRSMDPSNPAVKYTPGLGWTGLSRHVMLTMFWCFGGMVLVGCAVYYVQQNHWRGRAMWLGSIAIVLPIGYLFFWGTYGAAVWGAPWYLGPYYYMPIFAPIAILGAGGYVFFMREHRGVAQYALAGMLVLSLFVTGNAMRENLSFTRDDRRLNTAITNSHLHNAIVILPAFYGEKVLHPFATARNNWNTTSDVLYATDRGPTKNAETLLAYASRTPYELNISGQYRESPPDPTLTSTMTRLSLVKGKVVNLAIDFRAPTSQPVIAITVSINKRTDTFVIDTHSKANKHHHVDLNVTDDVTTMAGPALAHSHGRLDTGGQMQVQIGSAPNTRSLPQAFYFRRYGVVRTDGKLVVMLPGQGLNGYLTPEPVTVTAK